jgi:hypothetical protein
VLSHTIVVATNDIEIDAGSEDIFQAVLTGARGKNVKAVMANTPTLDTGDPI